MNEYALEIAAAEVWKKLKQKMTDILDRPTNQLYFEPIKPLLLKDGILSLQAPSKNQQQFLQARQELLLKYLKNIDPAIHTLRYKVSSKTTKTEAAQALSEEKVSRHIDSQLEKRFIFDNFLSSFSNRVAYHAGKSIARSPGKTPFNPLVIFGKSGVGKTHLVNAIGNLCLNLNPDIKVLYISAEKFINSFFEHTQRKAVNDFIHCFQLMDVLIVDDIQFFQKAPKSQDAFFAIFNHLHSAQKQIILTLDRGPKDLEEVHARLKGRFSAALVSEITLPDFNLKLEYLQYRCRNEQIDLPEEVLHYLAQNIPTIRELGGALISLIAETTLRDAPINADIHLARELVEKRFRQPAQTQPLSQEDIIELISAHLHISPEAILGRSRVQHTVMARQLSMFFIRQIINPSYKQIGSYFKKDHSTVMHSCEHIEQQLNTNKNLKKTVEEIKNKIDTHFS